ncbi:hypothetical protein [Glycomyces albidus]|jgi:hypothetical protein|uniref:DUF3558 domain-containing protein n=1 Tax=Glycomyces albidus TaxID=2656774 RepID=A0A6L5GF54_9ACTN|nr:hypothetical protein [Glycomyces albidus]MQM28344.1 hypothetical protein [Glycomyces albidus]
MLLAGGVVVGLTAVLGLIPWLMRFDLDYRFAVPESWSDTCLGDESTAAGLLDWEEPSAEPPEVADRESFHRYECVWIWRSASPDGGGQQLTMTIELDDDREFGPFDPSVEESLGLGSEDWYAERESLDGWEHGLCRQVNTDLDTSRYECIASAGNLRLTVESRDIPGGNGFEDEYFGPAGKSVEDLTVEIGELVRSVFRK